MALAIVLAQNEYSVIGYRGNVVMKYKIIYGSDFEKFEANVQVYIDDGWQLLGGPSIQIEEYMERIEGGRRYMYATQFRFHQAVTKEGEDIE